MTFFSNRLGLLGKGRGVGGKCWAMKETLKERGLDLLQRALVNATPVNMLGFPPPRCCQLWQWNGGRVFPFSVIPNIISAIPSVCLGHKHFCHAHICGGSTRHPGANLDPVGFMGQQGKPTCGSCMRRASCRACECPVLCLTPRTLHLLCAPLSPNAALQGRSWFGFCTLLSPASLTRIGKMLAFGNSYFWCWCDLEPTCSGQKRCRISYGLGGDFGDNNSLLPLLSMLFN